MSIVNSYIEYTKRHRIQYNDGRGGGLVPIADILQAHVEQTGKLAAQLGRITDQHHRTMTGSKLHDPENIESFRDCPCLTCKASTEVLKEYDELN